MFFQRIKNKRKKKNRKILTYFAQLNKKTSYIMDVHTTSYFMVAASLFSLINELIEIHGIELK